MLLYPTYQTHFLESTQLLSHRDWLFSQCLLSLWHLQVKSACKAIVNPQTVSVEAIRVGEWGGSKAQ